MDSRYTIGGSARHAARLAGVQILYQIEQSGSEPQIALDQFKEWYAEEGSARSEGTHGEKLPVDLKFLTKLVEGVCAHRTDLLELMKPHLAKDWTIERLPSVLRIILQAATFEIHHTDVPHPVVINEYIELARDFYADTEVAFVNGILDNISKKAQTASPAQ